MKTTIQKKTAGFQIKSVNGKSLNVIQKGIDNVKKAIDAARQQAYADMGLYA
jgi:hypothetical protein